MNKGKQSILVGIFLLILLISIISVSALKGSMGNARMILRPEVGIFGTTIERTILARNVNDIPIKVRLQPSNDFKHMVEVIDKEFILEPGEEKKARFNLNVDKPGEYNGRIAVYFSATEGEHPGVVLTSTVIIIAEKKGFWDSDDEEEDEEREEEDEEIAPITGSAISTGNTKNIPLITLSVLTTILIIVLLVLLIVKGNKPRGKKK